MQVILISCVRRSTVRSGISHSADTPYEASSEQSTRLGGGPPPSLDLHGAVRLWRLPGRTHFPVPPWARGQGCVVNAARASIAPVVGAIATSPR
jgi:hypothetical protein